MTATANLRLLVNMNLGFWGAQVGNGLQTANASLIFESLGAEVNQLPLLWLGAPLMGLIAQPVVGELSDRTWGPWGRRQPYFLGGAVLGAAMLGLLPLATCLWQAVAAYWLLQLALNVAVAPTRSFVGDLLSPGDRTLGYALQGFCIGLGTTCASGLPWLLGHLLPLHLFPKAGVPLPISSAYWVGGVLLLGSTLWTFLTIDEPPPPPPDTEAEAAAVPVWRSIIQAVTSMPPVMVRLAGVQILTWAGIYCIYLYLPTAIAFNILGISDKTSDSYSQAIEWAGLCIAFYNLVCLGVSFLIPWLSDRWGRVTVHTLCLLCGTLGLLSLFLVHSRYPILLSMVGVGIAWASILSVPYSLLMDELSERQSGVYMGLFNVFVTLPQLIMSVGFGWVMKTVLQSNRLDALALGAGFMGIAALLMAWVTEPPEPAPTPEGPQAEAELTPTP